MNTHWAVWNFGISAPWLLALLGAAVVLCVRGRVRWPRIAALAGLCLLFLTTVVDVGLENVCVEMGWAEMRARVFGTDLWAQIRRFSNAAGLASLVAAAFLGRARQRTEDDDPTTPVRDDGNSLTVGER